MKVLHFELEDFDTDEISKKCILVDEIDEWKLDTYVRNNYFRFSFINIKDNVYVYRSFSKCLKVTIYEGEYYE